MKEYPTITAVRLFEMVKGRGYAGQPGHFRHLVSRIRPPRPVEAFLRLKTLPGEQAQADWRTSGRSASQSQVPSLFSPARVLTPPGLNLSETSPAFPS
jgi:transposase